MARYFPGPSNPSYQTRSAPSAHFSRTMIMTTEYWCCNSWWCARNHCHHLQESLIWMILRLCSGFAPEKCIPWHPMRIRHCNNGLTFNVGGVGFSSHSCRRFLWLALLVCPQATVATSSGTYNNLVRHAGTSSRSKDANVPIKFGSRVFGITRRVPGTTPWNPSWR